MGGTGVEPGKGHETPEDPGESSQPTTPRIVAKNRGEATGATHSVTHCHHSALARAVFLLREAGHDVEADAVAAVLAAAEAES